MKRRNNRRRTASPLAALSDWQSGPAPAFLDAIHQPVGAPDHLLDDVPPASAARRLGQGCKCRGLNGLLALPHGVEVRDGPVVLGAGLRLPDGSLGRLHGTGERRRALAHLPGER